MTSTEILPETSLDFFREGSLQKGNEDRKGSVWVKLNNTAAAVDTILVCKAVV